MATTPRSRTRTTKSDSPAVAPAPAAPTPRSAPQSAAKSAAPIVLRGGLLVEIEPLRVRRGDLLIERGRIRGVGETEPPGATVVDCQGLVVLPGQLNAFARVHGPLLRLLPRPAATNLQQRLRSGLWRYESVLPEALLLGTAQLFALEALRSGVTTVLHRHSLELGGRVLPALAEALERVGLRGQLGVEISNRLGVEPAKQALRDSEQFLLQCSKTPRLVRGLCAAESVGSLDGTLADRLADQSARFQVPISIDFASSSLDQNKDGQRALDWLRWHGLLHERTLLTGGALFEADDLATAAGFGAALVALPRENRRLGLPDGRRLPSAERWLLGTGSAPPSIYAAFAEATEGQWQDGKDTIPVQLFAHHQSLMAQLFAAPFGRLEPGAPADLVVGRYASGLQLTEESLGRHLACGLPGLQIDTAIVDGELVLRDGRSLRIDEDRVRAEVHAAATDFLAGVGPETTDGQADGSW